MSTWKRCAGGCGTSVPPGPGRAPDRDWWCPSPECEGVRRRAYQARYLRSRGVPARVEAPCSHCGKPAYPVPGRASALGGVLCAAPKCQAERGRRRRAVTLRRRLPVAERRVRAVEMTRAGTPVPVVAAELEVSECTVLRYLDRARRGHQAQLARELAAVGPRRAPRLPDVPDDRTFGDVPQWRRAGVRRAAAERVARAHAGEFGPELAAARDGGALAWRAACAIFARAYPGEYVAAVAVEAVASRRAGGAPC